jgi:hypothetical protein
MRNVVRVRVKRNAVWIFSAYANQFRNNRRAAKVKHWRDVLAKKPWNGSPVLD